MLRALFTPRLLFGSTFCLPSACVLTTAGAVAFAGLAAAVAAVEIEISACEL
jgi:hypothetical protein